MTEGRAAPTFTLLPDGTVLATGGVTCCGYTMIQGAEVFDPQTDTWRAVADMSTTRYAHQATLLEDGRVLVTGGIGLFGGIVENTTELYDPVTGQWTPGPRMSDRRREHWQVPLSDGSVLLGGGAPRDFEAVRTVDRFDPATDTITRVAPMPFEATFQAFALLDDDRVVVAGGGTEGWAPFSGAAIYEPDPAG
jgi:Kelch motif